ncbi:MAG TPA: glycerol-3-phosphate acyltransferase [Anaerolineaceae bacterium]|nr:glycerol-3-phosphate acyltransferase [Anaerolineaceae bacterium]
MVEYWDIGLALLLSYLLGSVPCGLLIVKIASGKDIREVESGRTGGTNAMRAAGFLAGLTTAAFDLSKGAATALIVDAIAPGLPWVRVAAALLAILGHNYSVFLIEKTTHGRLRLRGGAGGATALGGAIALWPVSGLIIFPLVALTYVFIGYASVTTISITVFAFLVFAVRAALGLSPWIYALYGVLALLVVLWALRPNLKRLREGTERPVGLRAARLKKTNGNNHAIQSK